MAPMTEWVVIYAGGLPVNAWPNDREDWCYGARTGQSNELCGGCAYCLEMQARHADCEVKYVTTGENPEQSDLFGQPHLSFFDRHTDLVGTIIVTVILLGATLSVTLAPMLISWWLGAFK